MGERLEKKRGTYINNKQMLGGRQERLFSGVAACQLPVLL